MTKLSSLLAAALLAAGAACMGGRAAHPPAASSPPQATAPHQTAPGDAGGMAMAACPMSVPDTQLAVAETPDGQAVTFTTSPAHEPELRARVRAMAATHNRHHQPGAAAGAHGHPGAMDGMHHGMHHGAGMDRGSTGSAAGEPAGMMPPPSRAAAEDVPGGARLVVTPHDPADLELLRSTVRMHAEHMQQTGTCAMHPHGDR